MYKISITIVVYKDYDDVKEAVQTIEKYTDKKIKKHIYIVDNGPQNSNNIDALMECINSYDDVEYINTGENLGFGRGHNYVINELQSQFHAIVNPDIILKEDSFSNLIAFMEADESIGMCIPKLIDEAGTMQLVYRDNPTILDMFIRMFCKDLFPKRVKKHTLQYKDYSASFQVPFAQGSFLVIRTKLFKELKGFDNHYFMYMEDADLCRRVNQVSRLMYCPSTEVIHKWKKGSHKHCKLFIAHIKSMLYYFSKWGYDWF